MNHLPYNPGVLPSKPAPVPGDILRIELTGLPPYKDIGASIRNLSHNRREAFVYLRDAAIVAMDGKAWYSDGVKIDLVLRAPNLHARRDILDYVSGIMDTLGGSHGFTFTYLPIVYEDDCQIADIHSEYIECVHESYSLTITFL